MTTLEAISTTIGTFLASIGAGYLYTKATKRFELPELNSNLRLRAGAGMYRSKLIAIEKDAWVLSSPLCRNHYVPIRVGDFLIVEAPVSNGVYLFNTSLVSRNPETHEMRVEPPSKDIKPVNRRKEPRLMRNSQLMVDGLPGELVNISPLGGRIRTNYRVARGDRMRLDLEKGTIFGWVLDVWPTGLGDDYNEEIRLRFEDIVDLKIAS